MEINWLNKYSRTFLERGYLTEGITPEERIEQICKHFNKLINNKLIVNRFKEYLCKGYYSLSSPVWSNYGLERGLPISCFGSMIEDSVQSILFTQAEVGMMSKYGGGTSGYFGNVRERGSEIRNNGQSFGSVHFMQLFDKVTDIISQGSQRRGSFAAYLDIEHPDVEEFLEIKSDGNVIQNMFFGVCVGDEWLKEMKEGDKKKRKLWAKVLEKRNDIGLPYIFFKDNVNYHKSTPEWYRGKIYASNLCSEIALPSNEDISFVCCLSSMNLLHYDEWKDTEAVKILIYFLDTVITDFINSLDRIFGEDKMFMQRAYNFAKNHRSIGLGVLGWHSYLQKNSIAFDSFDASILNAQIFSLIQKESIEATKMLADLYGEPEFLRGTGYRNAALTAIAPTTSSAFILGQVSQSVEPLRSNYYVQDKAKIKITYKNPYLKEILNKYDKDNKETWDSIKKYDGSVQHLDFLSEHEKEVFKTFAEISQLSIIQQTAQRQQFIDQSQSINLMIHPKTPTKDINKLILTAHELGVKTLYYQHSINEAQELNRNLLTCSSCEA